MPLTYAVYGLIFMASFIPTWHTPFIFQVLKAQEIIFSNSKMGCEDYFFLYESASPVEISSGKQRVQDFHIGLSNFFYRAVNRHFLL